MSVISPVFSRIQGGDESRFSPSPFPGPSSCLTSEGRGVRVWGGIGAVYALPGPGCIWGMRVFPDFSPERSLGWPERLVAGVDEAGRGPLAGPVVAAAVILAERGTPAGLDDSKRLSAPKRAALYEALRGRARIGIGLAPAAEIDRRGIVAATGAAMARAVEALEEKPDVALVDGPVAPRLCCRAQALVRGDRLSLSVAAASIAAKVVRDRMMEELARRWPGYGFERHKGYGTRAHLAALDRLGATAEHRASFGPVRAVMGGFRNC